MIQHFSPCLLGVSFLVFCIVIRSSDAQSICRSVAHMLHKEDYLIVDLHSLAPSQHLLRHLNKHPATLKLTCGGLVALLKRPGPTWHAIRWEHLVRLSAFFCDTSVICIIIGRQIIMTADFVRAQRRHHAQTSCHEATMQQLHKHGRTSCILS